MVTRIDSAAYSADFAAMIVIALVRQHDPESADQMEKFWFREDEQAPDTDVSVKSDYVYEVASIAS